MVRPGALRARRRGALVRDARARSPLRLRSAPAERSSATRTPQRRSSRPWRASMVSLTALVLTITMVVVQLAMGQFSPRIVQRILQDKPSQLAIGLFVATFVHAILALREVTNDGDGTGKVPGHRGPRGVRARAGQHRRARHLRPPHRPGAARLGADRARRRRTRGRSSTASIRTRDRTSKPARTPAVVRSRRNPASSPASGTSSSSRRRCARTASWSWCRRSASSSPPARRCSGSTASRTRWTRDRLHEALILKLEPTLDQDVAYGIRHARRHRRALAVRLAVPGPDDGRAGDRPAARLPQAARAAPVPGRPHRDEAGEVRLTVPVDDLGGVRPARLRRDPHGRRGLAAGRRAG